MGHQVLECDFCGRHVIEGRNDWECICGAVYISGKTKDWVKPDKIKIKESTVIKPLGFVILF